MIEFDCPKCGKAISTPDADLRDWIMCPSCNAEVRPPPAAEAADRPSRGPSKRPSSTGSLGALLIVVGSLCMLLGLLTMLTWGDMDERALFTVVGCISFIGGWIIIGLGSAIVYLASIRHLLVELSDQRAER